MQKALHKFWEAVLKLSPAAISFRQVGPWHHAILASGASNRTPLMTSLLARPDSPVQRCWRWAMITSRRQPFPGHLHSTLNRLDKLSALVAPLATSSPWLNGLNHVRRTLLTPYDLLERSPQTAPKPQPCLTMRGEIACPTLVYLLRE